MESSFKSNIVSQLGNEDGSHSKPSKRLNISEFIVTLGPNIPTKVDYSPDSKHVQVERMLRELADDICGSEEKFKKIVRFRKEGHSYTKEFIPDDPKGREDNPRVNVGIEYGKRNKRFHLQMGIIIKHYSNLHLDRELLVSMCAKKFNIRPESVHIFIKPSYNEKKNDDAILDYATKDAYSN